MSQEAIRKVIEGILSEMGISDVAVHLDQPNNPSHGDLATNVALTLASAVGKSPRTIAEEIASHIKVGEFGIQAVEVAGPGFLNFKLSTDQVVTVLMDIIVEQDGYGRSDDGKGRKFMVEFVSANPTGPLHLGHGRQGALGDAIAGLLEWNGWSVGREYYYNDAGAQIDRLGESVWARYQQYLGEEIDLPEGGYQGEYVTKIAEKFAAEYGDRFKGDNSQKPLDLMKRTAIRIIRDEQDKDLSDFRIDFDVYFLESSLYENGQVESTVEALKKAGHVYDKDDAVWLRTTEFGDQKDRVMIKRDGSPTYFLPDVAYHIDKWNRGFYQVVNVQGADHHGTIARVQAGLQALGLPEGYPDYVLHQMVRVERDGKDVKLSKRSGSYITLRELMTEVGVDVTRYFFQMRKPEGHLVFDLDLALDQSDKNPVYKIQYAHVRMCSIFRKAGIERDNLIAENVDLSVLDTKAERELIKQLSHFPELIRRAARLRAPHIMCDYLEETAGAVNSWYHAGNPNRNPELAVLVSDSDLRNARLVLARAIQIVLYNGLSILGIVAPERMFRDSDTAVHSTNR